MATVQEPERKEFAPDEEIAHDVVRGHRSTYGIIAVVIVALVGLGVGWLVLRDSGGTDVTDSPAAVDASGQTEQVAPEPTDEVPSSVDSPDVTEPVVLPDFAADPLLVGDALTTAWATGDSDLFLSLFTPDAVAIFDDSGPLPVTESFHPDVGYTAAMNEMWEWTDCKPFGSNETAPIRCDVEVMDDWLALVGRGPWAGVATIESVAGQIVEFEFRLFGTDRDTAVTYGRFQDWAIENHPDEAALIWTNEPFEGALVFTEESARLQLQLGAEFVEACTSDEALDC